jgi:hypothetical protein
LALYVEKYPAGRVDCQPSLQSENILDLAANCTREADPRLRPDGPIASFGDQRMFDGPDREHLNALVTRLFNVTFKSGVATGFSVANVN